MYSKFNFDLYIFVDAQRPKMSHNSSKKFTNQHLNLHEIMRCYHANTIYQI